MQLCQNEFVVSLKEEKSHQVNVNDLEDGLRDDLSYRSAVPDSVWLATARYDKNSILGLDTTGVAHLRTWTVADDGDGATANSPTCQCVTPNRNWKRNHLEYLPNTRTPTDGIQNVHCMDVRKRTDLFATPAAAFHGLRSILSAGSNLHLNSPWVPEEDNDTGPDCVILVVKEAPETLTGFRVSDACPSWCLLSICRCNPLPEWLHQDLDEEAEAELLVYRRLLPRQLLASLHPETLESVPTPGCLWETIVTYPPEQEDQDEKPEPTISYRLTAQPYFDALSEYPELSRLVEPRVLQVLRQEANNIVHWTSWPEQQHYDSQSWHVFPLLYCFPGNNVKCRKMVDATVHMCPNTVALLHDILGDKLRTALFSRMQPESVLQAHTGWADLANHVLRLHVPIDIPELCGTWVDGCVEYHDTTNNLLIFDDSKIHRAFNYSQRPRVVLIVDVERPSDLPIGTATGGHSDELDSFIAQFSVPK